MEGVLRDALLHGREIMGTALSVHIETMRYPESEDSENLIEDLHLEVPTDTVVSLLGRSGVGKTTLLRIIAGFEHHFKGQIAINGNLVKKPSRGVQMVFQDYRLLPWKSVYENIEFATSRKDTQADCQQVEKWLKIVKLGEKRNEWPKNLSGGETGRVAFARAFVSSPTILLLDEPFSNLDMIAKFSLQNELQEYLRIHKTTVILVSHSIEDVVFLSDVIHVLSDHRMKIAKTFNVEVSRPRHRDDPLLNKVHREIIAYLLASRSGEVWS